MIETRVALKTSKDIFDFTTLCSKCEDKVLAYGGKDVVSAKSLIKMATLECSNPIKVEFYGYIPDEVKEGMKKFISV